MLFLLVFLFCFFTLFQLCLMQRSNEGLFVCQFANFILDYIRDEEMKTLNLELKHIIYGSANTSK